MANKKHASNSINNNDLEDLYDFSEVSRSSSFSPNFASVLKPLQPSKSIFSSVFSFFSSIFSSKEKGKKEKLVVAKKLQEPVDSDSKELQLLKKDVIKAVDKYISRWKLGVFGHHHNNRANNLKTKIQGCKSSGMINMLLDNQLKIMKGVITPEAPSSWSKSSLKESDDSLFTKPKVRKQGGYQEALQEASDIYNRHSNIGGLSP